MPKCSRIFNKNVHIIAGAVFDFQCASKWKNVFLESTMFTTSKWNFNVQRCFAYNKSRNNVLGRDQNCFHQNTPSTTNCRVKKSDFYVFLLPKLAGVRKCFPAKTNQMNNNNKYISNWKSPSRPSSNNKQNHWQKRRKNKRKRESPRRGTWNEKMH